MKFIIDDKIFNTETATVVLEYTQKYDTGYKLLGTYKMFGRKRIKIYITKKKNFYKVLGYEDETMYGEKISKKEVGELLKRHGAVDEYEKYFNKLEEA